MATSLFRRSLKPLSGRSWKPLAFSRKVFYVMPADEKFDEETITGYNASDYYPVRIGEVLRARYQVVGKICFERTRVASTRFKVSTNVDTSLRRY
ncbi:hypothetical protein E4U60_004319 [Claviceps pazoutovae]|uniref:Uncharacterized protein n=1 Tax=Claviceps pazoutovae TaxID=1649127 RepID=A0A9P7M908_9HYPO|nr:hypothetical protein E4U60_004319 [Claviceps pazoutovae]